jgi:hypothetical protein
VAPCWKRKAKKPRALLPRMLNRIVTVEILQRFSFVMAGALPRSGGARATRGRAAPEPAPAGRLRVAPRAPSY